MEMEFPKTPVLVADNSDVALFTIRIVDANGRLSPTAAIDLSFSLTGPGKIIGVGNGDPSSHEPDYPTSPTTAKRSSWNGLCRVIVQSTSTPGNVTLFANGPNLTGSRFVFSTK